MTGQRCIISSPVIVSTPLVLPSSVSRIVQEAAKKQRALSGLKVYALHCSSS